MEGLIFGLTYLWGEICLSKIDRASFIVGRKFTVFALFHFVFEGNFLRYDFGWPICPGVFTCRGLFS